MARKKEERKRFLICYRDEEYRSKLQNASKKYVLSGHIRTEKKEKEKLKSSFSSCEIDENGLEKFTKMLNVLGKEIQAEKTKFHDPFQKLKTLSIIGHLPDIDDPAKIFKNFSYILAKNSYMLVVIDDNENNEKNRDVFCKLFSCTGGTYYNAKNKLESFTEEALSKDINRVINECMRIHQLSGPIRDSLILHDMHDKHISKKILDEFIPKAKYVIAKSIFHSGRIQSIFRASVSNPDAQQDEEIIDHVIPGAAAASMHPDTIPEVATTSMDLDPGMDEEPDINVNVHPIQDLNDFTTSEHVFISDFQPALEVAVLLNSGISRAQENVDYLTEFIPDHCVNRCILYAIGQSTYEHSDLPRDEQYSYLRSEICPFNRSHPNLAGISSGNSNRASAGAASTLHGNTNPVRGIDNSRSHQSFSKTPSESGDSSNQKVPSESIDFTYIELDPRRRYHPEPSESIDHTMNINTDMEVESD